MKNTLTIVLLSLTLTTFSQTILLDENFTSGIPATWTVVDNDGFTPNDNQYTDAWIAYTSVFDTCAASTSYYVLPSGDEDTSSFASDYLITPQIGLLSFGNLLTWDAKSLDGSFPDGYQVLISTTDNTLASFTDTLLDVNSETPYWTSYSINLMTAGLGYTNQNVYIAFVNNTVQGYVLQIDNVKITGDDPAEVEENENEISIYPNPVSNNLNVNVDGLENVKIYNSQGQLVLEDSKNTIDASMLPNGLYFVEVKTSNGLIQSKFIKN
jgi:hypothetical protein